MTPPTQPGPGTDAKLLRAVGTWALAASIVNVTIGGGIFRLPAGAYASLGQAAPIAYLVCAVVIGLFVVCFAEAGSRVAQTGGLYAYVETAFGPLVGFSAGVMLWAGMTAALSAVSVFFADAVGALVPGLSSPLMKNVVITVVILLFAGLNVIGIRQATRFNVLMTVAKLAPLALVIGVGLTSLHAERLAPTMPAPSDIARGSVFLMFAFLGVESALVPSGEIKEPSRTIPRAIAIAMTGVVIVYLAIQLVTQSAMGDALGKSVTPVADAAGVLLGPWGRTFILAGSTISMFGYVSGMTLGVPRVLYAFARDGFMPAQLSSVHERFRTPHVAIGVQAVINILLATTGTFERLAILGNSTILLVYGACALGIFRLRSRHVRLESEPFVAPFGPAIPLLACLAIIWLLASLTTKEWLATLAPIGLAVAIYLMSRRRRAAIAV
jgi:APA family basic amino acid/polyamine antiporter